jgi:hypothetical protein
MAFSGILVYKMNEPLAASVHKWADPSGGNPFDSIATGFDYGAIPWFG